MAKRKIKWNQKAFPAILTSEAAAADVRRRATAIQEACGGEDDGFVVQGTRGVRRARAAVITGTAEAIRANAKHQTILNHLDAGR